MPKGDRAGPMGRGRMSGRAAGYCKGFDRPDYADPAIQGTSGMRKGRRRGGWGGPTAGGRGWRHKSLATGRMGRMDFGVHAFWPQSLNPDLEKESLRNQSQALRCELDAINQQITGIESQDKAP